MGSGIVSSHKIRMKNIWRYITVSPIRNCNTRINGLGWSKVAEGDDQLSGQEILKFKILANSF